MKKKFILLMFLITNLCLAMQRGVESNQIENRDGVVYLKGTNTPYTGMVKYMKDREYYVNGIANGKWLTFFDNGGIKSIGNWANGKLNGKYILYSEQGYKISQTTYINGVENGGYEMYYPDGRLHIKGQTSNGRPVGIWRFYNYDGSLKREINYNQTQATMDQITQQAEMENNNAPTNTPSSNRVNDLIEVN